MNFDDTPEEAAFRAEVRAWIDANAPKELMGPLSSSGFGNLNLGGFQGFENTVKGRNVSLQITFQPLNALNKNWLVETITDTNINMRDDDASSNEVLQFSAL